MPDISEQADIDHSLVLYPHLGTFVGGRYLVVERNILLFRWYRCTPHDLQRRVVIPRHQYKGKSC